MSKCCLCFCLYCCGQVLERNVEHFFLLVIYSIVLLYFYFFQSLQFIRLHSGQEKLGHSAIAEKNDSRFGTTWGQIYSLCCELFFNFTYI